jgi:transcriptional regulator GlxA family with amidase domain
MDYLVIEATRLLEHGNARSLLPVHPAVAVVRNLLDTQYQQPWRLQDLGNVAGMSPNHLVLLFHRETGRSPHRYLVEQRIGRARELLRESNLAIGQIAMDLGFSSSQHFAKTFQQMTGMTASGYRRSS